MSILINENILHIQQRIRQACESAGRNPNEVKLLMATKTVTPSRIVEAMKTGNTLIAENKIQELKEKYEALKPYPHTNHFIGHLQSNKINDLLRCEVQCLQSLDRITLAEKLQQKLEQKDKFLNVLIQVNTSGELSKFGVAPSQTLALVRAVSRLDRLCIKGLMTIGIFSSNVTQARPCFQLLKQLQGEVIKANIPGVSMDELSMGMSGDLEIAIAEGATIIRVGTAIFGSRQYPDSYYWNENKKID